MTTKSTAPASPRPAAILMTLTYVTGFIGSFLGFYTLNLEPPTLAWSVIIGVTIPGVLSFLRHGVFNRSDAVRGGWDYGQRNNFQIEVGLANLAWGLFALLAVVLDWGLAVQASSYLVSGLYFASVTVFVIVSGDLKDRKVGGLIGIAIWAAICLALGFMGIAAAG